MTPTRVTQIAGSLIVMTAGIILGILMAAPLIGLAIGLCLSALTVTLSALDDPDRLARLDAAVETRD